MKESWEINDDAHCVLSLACNFSRDGKHITFDLEELGIFLGTTQKRVAKILEGLRRNGDIAYIAPKKKEGKYYITLLRRITIDDKFKVRLVPKEVAS